MTIIMALVGRRVDAVGEADTDGCSAILEYVLSGLKSRAVKKALATSVGGTSERSEGKQSDRSRLHAP
jgi:hypothetical protein